jgi:hypothetical protein
MDINPVDIPCHHCKQPLQTVQATAHLGACTQCGKRVLMDESFREAIAIATTNEAWIEKIFWKESNNTFLALFMFFFIDFPLVTLKYVGWFIVLCSLGMANGSYFGGAPIGWAAWSLIPLSLVAAFGILRFLKRGIEKAFANHFVTLIHFIVSSRGIVIVSPVSQPFLLPWSSIVDYSWTSQIETLTSQMVLSYATADGQVATILLEGEERVQPLGELVDILHARLGR